MPEITVTANRAGERPVMWRERVTGADLQSHHFCAQLLERLIWAVNDATEAEQARSERSHRTRAIGADDFAGDDEDFAADQIEDRQEMQVYGPGSLKPVLA